ncbi:hypothetical protein C8R47DRAFT_1067169 [Mycena vitilis]|nr:hypothetical protein C8R47DRAFT_1067169 [Mycena vitilis]
MVQLSFGGVPCIFGTAAGIGSELCPVSGAGNWEAPLFDLPTDSAIQELLLNLALPSFDNLGKSSNRMQGNLQQLIPSEYSDLASPTPYPDFSAVNYSTRPMERQTMRPISRALMEVGSALLSPPPENHPTTYPAFARELAQLPCANPKRKRKMPSAPDGTFRVAGRPSKRTRIVEYEPPSPPKISASLPKYIQKNLRSRKYVNCAPSNHNNDENPSSGADVVETDHEEDNLGFPVNEFGPISGTRRGGRRRAAQNRHAQKNAYCFDCNKPFTRRTDLTRHLTSTKAHKGKGVICEKCESILARGDSLIRHQDGAACLKRRR